MTPNEMMIEAVEAANTAGDAWMAEALERGPRYTVHNSGPFGARGPAIDTMLDLCGNAYIKFSDRRSTHYRQFKKAGFASLSGSVIIIPHKWKHRQEIGLQIACIEAAIKKLNELGVTGIYTHSYID